MKLNVFVTKYIHSHCFTTRNRKSHRKCALNSKTNKKNTIPISSDSFMWHCCVKIISSRYCDLPSMKQSWVSLYSVWMTELYLHGNINYDERASSLHFFLLFSWTNVMCCGRVSGCEQKSFILMLTAKLESSLSCF